MSHALLTGEHRHLHSFPTRRSSDLNPDCDDSGPGCAHPSTPPSRSRVGSVSGCTSKRRTSGTARRRRGASCTRCTSARTRSEEHTSELQSLAYLVCRLLLEKNNITK